MSLRTLLVALIVLAAASAHSETTSVPCATPENLLADSAALPKVAARIASGARLSVVALGSSSTFGTGATAPAASYPAQLEAILQETLPLSPITVANKGVPGDRIADMMGRITRDVLDLHPDLLIWQTGTNSALDGSDAAQYGAELRRGVAQVRAAGIDLVLITPQYSPAFVAIPQHPAYLARIAAIAAESRVALYRRFEIMRHWQDHGRSAADELIGPDGLHMTDLGYRCLARTLARMIVRLSVPGRRPAPSRSADVTLDLTPR